MNRFFVAFLALIATVAHAAGTEGFAKVGRKTVPLETKKYVAPALAGARVTIAITGDLGRRIYGIVEELGAAEISLGPCKDKDQVYICVSEADQGLGGNVQGEYFNIRQASYRADAVLVKEDQKIPLGYNLAWYDSGNLASSIVYVDATAATSMAREKAALGLFGEKGRHGGRQQGTWFPDASAQIADAFGGGKPENISAGQLLAGPMPSDDAELREINQGTKRLEMGAANNKRVLEARKKYAQAKVVFGK